MQMPLATASVRTVPMTAACATAVDARAAMPPTPLLPTAGGKHAHLRGRSGAPAGRRTRASGRCVGATAPRAVPSSVFRAARPLDADRCASDNVSGGVRYYCVQRSRLGRTTIKVPFRAWRGRSGATASGYRLWGGGSGYPHWGGGFRQLKGSVISKFPNESGYRTRKCRARWPLTRVFGGLQCRRSSFILRFS